MWLEGLPRSGGRKGEGRSVTSYTVGDGCIAGRPEGGLRAGQVSSLRCKGSSGLGYAGRRQSWGASEWPQVRWGMGHPSPCDLVTGGLNEAWWRGRGWSLQESLPVFCQHPVCGSAGKGRLCAGGLVQRHSFWWATHCGAGVAMACLGCPC